MWLHSVILFSQIISSLNVLGSICVVSMSVILRKEAIEIDLSSVQGSAYFHLSQEFSASYLSQVQLQATVPFPVHHQLLKQEIHVSNSIHNHNPNSCAHYASNQRRKGKKEAYSHAFPLVN